MTPASVRFRLPVIIETNIKQLFIYRNVATEMSQTQTARTKCPVTEMAQTETIRPNRAYGIHETEKSRTADK